MFSLSALVSQIPPMPTNRSSYCLKRSSSWRCTTIRSVHVWKLSCHNQQVLFGPHSCFGVVALGVHSASAEREGLLRRTDPGGGSRVEGQNGTVADAGKLYSNSSGVLTSFNSKCIISLLMEILLCFFGQVSLVAEERDQNISRVQELETAITELKSAAGKRFRWPLFRAFSWLYLPYVYATFLLQD